MWVPMSANEMMSSRRLSVTLRGTPSTAALTKMFWRPVNSGLNPLPSSSRAATRSGRSTRPALGWSTPARICKSVLLPAPFRPMMPNDSPAITSKLTSRSAQCSL